MTYPAELMGWRWLGTTTPTLRHVKGGMLSSVVTLFACPLCSAAVAEDDVDRHSEWHSERGEPL